jgi:hypothetical protein
MKQKSKIGGMLMLGSLRSAGITTYMRNGKVITRVAQSFQKRSNTRYQFIQRQRMRHTISLWKKLKYCNVMFTQRPVAYQNFASLANRLPAVFFSWRCRDVTFLMPGIPISDGSLPTINQYLGEVDGVPALLTDLKKTDLDFHDTLRLYTAEQKCGEFPEIEFCMRELSFRELTLVDGRFVLKGEEFSDNLKGWALVRVNRDRCSPQGIVTRCTFYEQYTTEEAMQKAAKEYGGLTETAITHFL